MIRIRNKKSTHIDGKVLHWGNPMSDALAPTQEPIIFDPSSTKDVIALGQDEMLARLEADADLVKCTTRRSPRGFLKFFRRIMEEGGSNEATEVFPVKTLRLQGVRLIRKLFLDYRAKSSDLDDQSVDFIRYFDEGIDEAIDDYKSRITNIGAPEDQIHWFESTMSTLFRLDRESKRRSQSLPDNPDSYNRYRKKLFSLGPEKLLKELTNARKDTKNVDRRRNAEYFIDDMYYPMVELPFFYGAMKVFDVIESEFASEDSKLFTLCFLFNQQRFLDHIIPALHPIHELFLRSPRFMEIAQRAYSKDATNFDELHGAFLAAGKTYQYYCMTKRENDRWQKAKKHERSSEAGMDIYGESGQEWD